MSACKACSNDREPKGLTEIGRPVTCLVTVGRGHDQTEHTFFQCDECGSVWVRLVDSGAGGHGRFMRRLTADLF